MQHSLSRQYVDSQTFSRLYHRDAPPAIKPIEMEIGSKVVTKSLKAKIVNNEKDKRKKIRDIVKLRKR